MLYYAKKIIYLSFLIRAVELSIVLRWQLVKFNSTVAVNFSNGTCICTLPCTLPCTDRKLTESKLFRFPKGDYEAMNLAINNQQWDMISDSPNVNKAWDNFHSIILSLMNIHTLKSRN